MNEFWFDGNETKLFAVEDGAGGLVVLLHGGMADHRAVMPYMGPLSKQFRVIAPDLRSSGRSWCGLQLTFDRLTADLRALLDHLNAQKAVVIGVSGGTGVATHFALQHPERLAGLVLIHPVYGGEERGFSSHQQAVFAWMDAMASQALVKGVEVLEPLYANAPSEYREQAIEMAMGFDAASVVATSQLLASGSQPFKSLSQLKQLDVQTLIVKGADEMHPAAIADEYQKNLPHGRGIDQSDPALMSKLEGFCSDCLLARV